MFTIGLFIFYFSADAPRFKRWVARLLPTTAGGLPRRVGPGGEKDRRRRPHRPGGDQRVTRRGLPAPHRNGLLARLGIWTGVVAQFVPTIGTYIAIALPVVVGLTSADPVDVLALAFALVYQQVENLTIEPKISANAVDMHPAVAFASVLLGRGALRRRGCLLRRAGRGSGAGAVRDLQPLVHELLPQFDSPTPPPARQGRLGRKRAQPQRLSSRDF